MILLSSLKRGRSCAGINPTTTGASVALGTAYQIHHQHLAAIIASTYTYIYIYISYLYIYIFPTPMDNNAELHLLSI
jgi:hypothetical protein